MLFAIMSSHKMNSKRVPGPRNVCIIRYLEGLANKVCISQLEEPCSSIVLSSMYSHPERKPRDQMVAGNTLDNYLIKKQ